MICGGTEAPVTRVSIAGFGAMRAISRRNDDPERASRPFDGERDGFVMGEAAAMVVIEELEHARARGAKIYAELLGYGVSSDANHVSDPDPTRREPGPGADDGVRGRRHRAGRRRLRQRARHVDTGRRHGRDARAEGGARRGQGLSHADLVHEGRHRPLPRRGRRGGGDLHDPGARSAASCRRRSTRRRRIPTCDLDYIPNEARREQVEIGVSNSFGFGGHNACLVFRRWHDED